MDVENAPSFYRFTRMLLEANSPGRLRTMPCTMDLGELHVLANGIATQLIRLMASVVPKEEAALRWINACSKATADRACYPSSVPYTVAEQVLLLLDILYRLVGAAVVFRLDVAGSMATLQHINVSSLNLRSKNTVAPYDNTSLCALLAAVRESAPQRDAANEATSEPMDMPALEFVISVVLNRLLRLLRSRMEANAAYLVLRGCGSMPLDCPPPSLDRQERAQRQAGELCVAINTVYMVAAGCCMDLSSVLSLPRVLERMRAAER